MLILSHSRIHLQLTLWFGHNFHPSHSFLYWLLFSCSAIAIWWMKYHLIDVLYSYNSDFNTFRSPNVFSLWPALFYSALFLQVVTRCPAVVTEDLVCPVAGVALRLWASLSPANLSSASQGCVPCEWVEHVDWQLCCRVRGVEQRQASCSATPLPSVNS